MSKTILVVAETKGGVLRQVSYEAISAARMAAGDGGTVAAAVIGAEAARYAADLAPYGVDHIYTVEHSALIHYHPEAYFAALQAVVQEAKPDGVFFGHTAQGKDLAPQLAAALGAGQISDVIAIDADGSGELLFTRPLYAGKAMEKKSSWRAHGLSRSVRTISSRRQPKRAGLPRYRPSRTPSRRWPPSFARWCRTRPARWI